MAAAETARLVASLELKDNFSASARKIEQSIGRLGKSATDMSKAVASSRASAVALGVGIERVAEKGINLLVDAVQGGVDALGQLQTAQEQTAAVIASTGGKAGVSAEQVRSYADALENVTTVDDKAIQGAENLLLTFTGISKETFPDATKAVVNLGIAMAQGDVANADFKSSAIQIGKALNDPIKGITALTRVGVSFTEAQKDQIKALVKSGDTLGAQRIILKELETEFGKAGEAAGKGFPADQRRLQDAVEDSQIALARGLLPALTKISQFITTKLQDPKAQKFFEDLGRNIGDALQGALDFAQKVPWDRVGDALRIAADAARSILGFFTSLPPWVQTAVITGWGLNKISGGAVTDLFGAAGKGLLGGIADAIGKQFAGRGSTPVNPLFVEDVTGGKGAGDLLGAGGLKGLLASLGGGSALAGGAIAAGAVGGGVALGLAIDGLTKAVNEQNAKAGVQTDFNLSDFTNPVSGLIKSIDFLSQVLGLNKDATKDNTTANESTAAAIRERGRLPGGNIRGQATPGVLGRSGDELAGVRAGAAAVAAARQREVDLRGKALDDIEAVKRATAAAALGLGKIYGAENRFAADLRAGLAGLTKATNRNDIKAQARAIAAAITKGAGNAANTKKAVDELRAAQATAIKNGDTALAHELGGYIKRVEAKLPNREFVAAQLDTLKGIQSDGVITADEQKKLRAIQSTLLAHGDRHAADIVAKTIALGNRISTSGADTRSELAGVRAAVNASKSATSVGLSETTQAIKDKDLSVTVPVSVTAVTTIRGITTQQRIYSNIRKTAD